MIGIISEKLKDMDDRMRKSNINLVAFLDGENAENERETKFKEKLLISLYWWKTWILRFGNYNKSQAEQIQRKLCRDTLW